MKLLLEIQYYTVAVLLRATGVLLPCDDLPEGASNARMFINEVVLRVVHKKHHTMKYAENCQIR